MRTNIVNSTSFPADHWIFRFLNFSFGEEWKYNCEVGYVYHKDEKLYLYDTSLDSCRIVTRLFEALLKVTTALILSWLAGVVLTVFPAAVLHALLHGVSFWGACGSAGLDAAGDLSNNTSVHQIAMWMMYFLGFILYWAGAIAGTLYLFAKGIRFAYQKAKKRFSWKSTPKPPCLVSTLMKSVKDRFCWKITLIEKE